MTQFPPFIQFSIFRFRPAPQKEDLNEAVQSWFGIFRDSAICSRNFVKSGRFCFLYDLTAKGCQTVLLESPYYFSVFDSGYFEGLLVWVYFGPSCQLLRHCLSGFSFHQGVKDFPFTSFGGLLSLNVICNPLVKQSCCRSSCFTLITLTRNCFDETTKLPQSVRLGFRE